jgi:hypothetical protein
MKMTINGCLVLLDRVIGHGFRATVGNFGLCMVYGLTEIEVLGRVALLLTED